MPETRTEYAVQKFIGDRYQDQCTFGTQAEAQQYVYAQQLRRIYVARVIRRDVSEETEQSCHTCADCRWFRFCGDGQDMCGHPSTLPGVAVWATQPACSDWKRQRTLAEEIHA